MYINHDKKFVFVSVPKAASTSINVMLNNNFHQKPSLHHSPIEDIINRYPEISDYYRFGFTRNPWDKFVSCYFNFIQEKSHRKWAWPIKFNYKNFKEFCHDFPDTKWVEWAHFRPNFHFLSINGEPAMDFIGRFENLEEDLIKLDKKFEMFGAVLPRGWYPVLRNGRPAKFNCNSVGKHHQADHERSFLKRAISAGGICVLKSGKIVKHKAWVDQRLREKDLAEEISYWTDGETRWIPMEPKHEITIPHSRPSRHENYRKYYDSETEKIIGDFYHKDIEMFGYKF